MIQTNTYGMGLTILGVRYWYIDYSEPLELEE